MHCNHLFKFNSLSCFIEWFIDIQLNNDMKYTQNTEIYPRVKKYAFLKA